MQNYERKVRKMKKVIKNLVVVRNSWENVKILNRKLLAKIFHKFLGKFCTLRQYSKCSEQCWRSKARARVSSPQTYRAWADSYRIYSAKQWTEVQEKKEFFVGRFEHKQTSDQESQGSTVVAEEANAEPDSKTSNRHRRNNSSQLGKNCCRPTGLSLGKLHLPRRIQNISNIQQQNADLPNYR